MHSWLAKGTATMNMHDHPLTRALLSRCLWTDSGSRSIGLGLLGTGWALNCCMSLCRCHLLLAVARGAACGLPVGCMSWWVANKGGGVPLCLCHRFEHHLLAAGQGWHAVPFQVVGTHWESSGCMSQVPPLVGVSWLCAALWSMARLARLCV